MGQALDIPVYYKHERFNAIIPFPPMPVALDSSLWERASGLFTVLGETNEMVAWAEFRDEWDERFEPLVNRVEVEGDHGWKRGEDDLAAAVADLNEWLAGRGDGGGVSPSRIDHACGAGADSPAQAGLEKH